MNGHHNGASKPANSEIVADPAWFPECFDARRNEFLFVATDRHELSAQTFLDARWDRKGAAHVRLNANAITLPGAGERRPEIGIVWHSAFCCSTLLAKALDRPGANLSLCEPQLLVDIAQARRTKLLSEGGVSEVAQIALRLLSRPFAPGESVIVKPSPAANNLLRDTASDSAGPMLFLFSDCRSFIISIVRLGEDGRRYVRQLFLALLAEGPTQAQWPPAKLLSMSDLELAALVWHMQIAEFRRSWAKLPPGGAASLDCDAFLASPKETLVRLDRFFSLGIAEPQLEETATGPLFRRNAKTGEEAWDAARRREQHARIALEIEDDLKRIVAESYELCPATPRGLPLPNPIIPVDKRYSPET